MVNAKTKYKEIAVPKLMEAFGYKNQMSIPTLVKLVVNIGIGKLGKEKEKSEKRLGGRYEEVQAAENQVA